MTVRELIEHLKESDMDALVVLQKDAEGNGYSPLAGLDVDLAYLPDTTYSGSVKFKRLTPQLRREGFTREDVGAGENCVVLYPIN